MTPERKAKLNEAFGSGLVIFGQKRPDSSKPNSPLTPEQVEQGLSQLKARTGFEMAQDDPMRSAAAAMELSLERLYAHLDDPATDSLAKAQ